MMRKFATLTLVIGATACAQSSSSEPPSSKPAPSPQPTSAPAAAESQPAAASAPMAGAGLPEAPARGDDADRKSKNGELEATIGGVRVRVRYGRPEVRGRKVFGSLIPYGKVWRTGADEATTISFAKAAMFAGQKVERGTYALFTVPGESGWKVMLNREAQQWGAYKRDAAENALTADVSAAPHDSTEVLTFAASDDALVLRWADVAVTIPVSAAK